MKEILIISADRSDADGLPINLGDAFLTDRLLAAVVRRGCAAVALDFGEGKRRTSSSRLRAGRALVGMLSAVRRSSAVILGGGTLLQDDVGRGFGGLPRLVLVASMVGWLLGRPVYFFGVGVDQVDRRAARRLLSFATWRRTLVVRDLDSASRAMNLTDRPALVGADTSLLGSRLVDALDEAEAPDDRVAILALNMAEARDLTSDVLRKIRTEYPTLIFLQMSQSGGFSDAAALPESVAKEFDLVTRALDWPQALEMISRSDAVIASRMHALYMGLETGRPLLAVGGHAKVQGFSREFEIPTIDSLLDYSQECRPSRGSSDARHRAALRAESALDLVMAEICVEER